MSDPAGGGVGVAIKSPPSDRFSALATLFWLLCIQATGTAFMPRYRGYRRVSFSGAILAFLLRPATQNTHAHNLVLLLAPSSIDGVGQHPREILKWCRNETLARRAR